MSITCRYPPSGLCCYLSPAVSVAYLTCMSLRHEVLGMHDVDPKNTLLLLDACCSSVRWNVYSAALLLPAFVTCLSSSFTNFVDLLPC